MPAQEKSWLNNSEQKSASNQYSSLPVKTLYNIDTVEVLSQQKEFYMFFSSSRIISVLWSTCYLFITIIKVQICNYISRNKDRKT
jgi:hypothetical protein